jgi:hypothetical protein
MRERVRIAALLSAAIILAAGCNASIGGDDGASDIEAADAGDSASGADASAPADSSDAGTEIEALSCLAGGDASVGDPATRTCYYYIGSAPLAWDAAKTACEGMGGQLASIGSSDESELVGTIAPSTADGLQDIWVGGTDSPTEGEWHWIDGTAYFDDNAGTAIGYINWRGVEPNNNTGQNLDGENCMIIEGDNNLVDRGPQWDDRSCLVAYPYMCEVPEA